VSWDQVFFDPIMIDGKTLRTLRDAAQYITKLPKAEHDADEWQAAMEALLLVAELDGPPMFARIGVMRALNRGPEESTVPRRLGGSGTVQATHHCGNVTQSIKLAILEVVPATPLNMRAIAASHARSRRHSLCVQSRPRARYNSSGNFRSRSCVWVSSILSACHRHLSA